MEALPEVSRDEPSPLAVGGQSGDQAGTTLTAALAPVAGRPVVLVATAVKVSTTPKALGLRVDVPATVEVAAVAVPPKVTAQVINGVRSDFADVAVSSPVTLTANGTTFAVSPKAFAPAIVLAPDTSGRITPRADPKKLSAVVRGAAGKAGSR